MGKLGLLTRTAATNQAVCAIFPPKELDTRFLFWYLRHRRSDLIAQAVGGAQPNISQSILRALEVPVPPVDDQRRIVAEIEKQFSRLDEAVANLKRVKANLKRYKAAVLKAAVEGRLVPTEAELARREGRRYETGAQLVERIATASTRMQSEKGRTAQEPKNASEESYELPAGWARTSIGRLASLVEYGSSAKTSESVVGVPVLRMGNIVDGDLDLTDLKSLPDAHNEFPRLLLKPGDLLFNRTNSPELVGKTAVYKGSPSISSFASYLIRVRFIVGCSSEFISAFLNSVYGRRWVKSVVTQQVGQANVNGTKLQNLLVPVPPAAEQVRIVQEMDRHLSLVRHCEKLVNSLAEKTAAERRSLLSRSFACDG